MEKEQKSKPKSWKRTAAYKELETDLLQGLRDAGMDQPRYRDLVEEYMICWIQVKELDEDIKERGTWVPYKNGSQTGMTENKSLGTKIRLLKTMDDIFRRLGYQDEARNRRSTAAMTSDGEDDEL